MVSIWNLNKDGINSWWRNEQRWEASVGKMKRDNSIIWPWERKWRKASGWKMLLMISNHSCIAHYIKSVKSKGFGERRRTPFSEKAKWTWKDKIIGYNAMLLTFATYTLLGILLKFCWRRRWKKAFVIVVIRIQL